MSELNWSEERERLFTELREAKQIAAESQAESAVYRDILEDCYEAVRQALAHNDLSLLPKLVSGTMFFTTPSQQDVRQWGKYFLDAYMRDARWLNQAKEALQQIKDDAQKLSVEDKKNIALKDKIISTAEVGLSVHI